MANSKTSSESLLKSLQAMSELQLQRLVVVPLLKAMFTDARVEETSGPNEAGRDVVCIDKHPYLQGRPFIRCIQIKNKPISSGTGSASNSIMTVKIQVEEAKKTAVLGPSAERYVPSEVWVVNSYPLSDTFRRKSSVALSDIAALGGMLIDGTDLEKLLQKYCPSLVADIVGVSAKAVGMVAGLSVHRESRAFGLRLDRNIDDFYVQARLVPGTTLAGQFLSNAIDVLDREILVGLSMTYGQFLRSQKSGEEILPADLQDRTIGSLHRLATQYGVEVRWELEISDLAKEAEVSANDIVRVRRGYTFFFGSNLTKRRSDLESDLQKLPQELSGSVSSVRLVLEAITEIERFLNECREQNLVFQVDDERSARPAVGLKRTRSISRRPKRSAIDIKSVRVANELDILSLGNVVFVEAGPGSGKTTLLRRVAIASLKSNKPTFFIECSQLRGVDFFRQIGERENQRLRLLAEEQAKKRGINATALFVPLTEQEAFSSISRSEKLKLFGELLQSQCRSPDIPEAWKFQNANIVLDGLDELETDLHSVMVDTIKDGFFGASRIVVSSRDAYNNELRHSASRIWISLFSEQERDDFFSKWFKRDAEGHARAVSLVRENADINENTRVPLIATLVAALVEHKFEPTTRVEIYQGRLRLLLGDWDKARGVVSRSNVEAKYKFRYVSHLAYFLHSRRRKSSTLDEALQVFADSLGSKGYSIGFEQLIDELVKASGVLLRDGAGNLSFGHLSFQEHLTGEYLAQNFSVQKLRELLGNEWWKESLLFYAGIKGDITPLINFCEKLGVARAYQKQLFEMTRVAPFTSGVAADVLLTLG